MNKNVKRSIVAMMVAGMTLSGAAGVYAGSNMQKITAYLNQNIGFKINGTAYTPTDASGHKLAPIVYQDTTYLPVRALSEALKASVSYDSKTGIISIVKSDSSAGGGTGTTDEGVKVVYSTAQVNAIKQEFAKFDGFETAYAPQLMVKGDSFIKAAAGEDGVRLLFTHMSVSVSPRDYSYLYDGTAVTLEGGLKGKWYKPGDTELLTVNIDDRYVTLSSTDGSLTKAQLEKVASSVAKLK